MKPRYLLPYKDDYIRRELSSLYLASSGTGRGNSKPSDKVNCLLNISVLTKVPRNCVKFVSLPVSSLNYFKINLIRFNSNEWCNI